MPKEEQGASLKPSEAGGGLGIDDCNGIIEKMIFVDDFDYGGTRDATFALQVTISSEDYEELQVEHLTAGDLERWQPSRDGKRAVPIGSSTVLNKNCNAVLFMASLVNAGFPEEKIEQDADAFEGTHCHFKRVPQPTRAGLKKEGGDTGTVLAVDKIHAYPWDKKAKGKAKGKAAAKAEVEEAPDEAVEEKATATVLELIAAGNGNVTKDKLLTAAFKHLSKDPLRNPVTQLLAKKSFLENGPWAYEDETLSLGD